MMPPGGTDVHSWQVPGLSGVTGGMGSGTVPSLLVMRPDRALHQPSHGSIPELGEWKSRIWPERWSQQPHTHFGLQEMGETDTQGTLLVVSVREKERAGGFKNKCICSALLKIEKVALNSSPTKGLKVKQAPNRKRLSAK